MLKISLLGPRLESLPLPWTEYEPLVHLRVEDGFSCDYCTLVKEIAIVLRKHYNVEHAPLQRSRSGQKSSSSHAVHETLEQQHFGGQTPWKTVKGPGSAGLGAKNCVDQPSGTDGRIDL